MQKVTMISVKYVFAFLALSITFVASAPRRTYSKSVNIPEKALLEAIFNDTMKIGNGREFVRWNGEDNVCYDELGCFDSRNGVFSYIGELPYSPEQINTKFTLFTR